MAGIAVPQFRPPAAGVSTPNATLPSRGSARLSLGNTSRSSYHQSRSPALRWTSSKAFGTQTFLPERCPVASVHRGKGIAGRQPWVVRSYTQEQAKLVKDSWKLVQKNDPGKHAVNFFVKIFEIAPTVKKMFSFMRDSSGPMEKNPKLKIHALQVFTLTGQCAAELSEKGGLNVLLPKLMELGHSHADYGVLDEHFDVVKYALLVTLAEGFPDVWNAELKEAWATAYDELVFAIKSEMKIVRQRQSVAA